MQCVGIHTTGKHFAGSRGYGVVGTCQAGDGVEEDDNIVSAFHHAFCFFKDDAGNLHVAFCRFVEGRGDYFRIDGTRHVGNFLRAFVDEQHNHVDFRMIGGNGVGNVFHQDGLTGFGLCHNQGTLALTDGGKQVYDTGRHRVGVSAFAKLELLVREEGGEVLERYAVAYESRVTSVYFGYFYQREVLFAFFRGTDYAFYHITGFQAEQFDL